MTDLTNLTVHQVLDAMGRGEFSSRELTEAYLQAVDRSEKALHAFITLTPDTALAAADEADQRRSAWREGDKPLPVLLGLPIAVKDVLSVAGVRATCGSRILENYVPPFTATAVQKLLDAGVIILGKTNTDEFAMGSSTENSAYGVTHNPWDISRVPGGSSGGSAVTVAARMAPAALGTDTGGSVRQPASFCGVTGIKPTYGRVSRYGLIAYGSSLDVAGVLARNVRDTALLFSHMAGQDTRDATTLDAPVPDITFKDNDDLSGLRIGVPQEYFIEGIQDEVESNVRKAIDTLHSLGAEVKPVSLPYTEYALPVYYLIAPAEASANLARYDGVRYSLRVPSEGILEMFCKSRGLGFGPEVKRRIMLGTYALSAGYYDAYYNQAQKVRTLIKRDFERVFQEVDVIAAPVAPTTAFRIGEHGDDPLSMYLEDIFTLPANLAGVPALSFPVGFDSQRLPVGIQLMGPACGEEVLFRMGHAYQQATGWHMQKPGQTLA